MEKKSCFVLGQPCFHVFASTGVNVIKLFLPNEWQFQHRVSPIRKDLFPGQIQVYYLRLFCTTFEHYNKENLNQMKLYTKDNEGTSLIKHGSWIENSS
jgi:hypothetical protein